MSGWYNPLDATNTDEGRKRAAKGLGAAPEPTEAPTSSPPACEDCGYPMQWVGGGLGYECLDDVSPCRKLSQVEVLRLFMAKFPAASKSEPPASSRAERGSQPLIPVVVNLPRVPEDPQQAEEMGRVMEKAALDFMAGSGGAAVEPERLPAPEAAQRPGEASEPEQDPNSNLLGTGPVSKEGGA